MPKSRNRKGHKKKVKARNKRINQLKKSKEKMQKKYLMDLIEKEKEKGAFEDTPNIDIDNLNIENGPEI